MKIGIAFCKLKNQHKESATVFVLETIAHPAADVLGIQAPSVMPLPPFSNQADEVLDSSVELDESYFGRRKKVNMVARQQAK